MQRLIILLLLCTVPNLSPALNLENAKRINRSCALCHGNYGQGTPGTLSPRLAGLPAEYLAKELRYYRDGIRTYDPMVVASSIDSMTDKDIDDISEYLAGVNLRNLNLPEIPAYTRGDKARGQSLFQDDCKQCHRRTGLGKPHKGIPPVAGQYGSYLFGQMKRFQKKERYHDDDPDDETFDAFDDTQLDDLVTYLTSLPPHGEVETASRFELSADSMAAAASMGNMMAMVPAGTLEPVKPSADAPEAIAGRFRILPSGDILLRPSNQDMRQVAGLSGRFKVTPDGILFIPEPER
jgi:cytochrome c553